MRTAYLGIVVVGLLFVARALRADEPKGRPKPAPLTPEQVADEVVSAVRTGDQRALRALAAQDEPDPWLVVGKLCHRGEHDRSGRWTTRQHVRS